MVGRAAAYLLLQRLLRQDHVRAARMARRTVAIEEARTGSRIGCEDSARVAHHESAGNKGRRRRLHGRLGNPHHRRLEGLNEGGECKDVDEHRVQVIAPMRALTHTFRKSIFGYTCPDV